jgi:DegV family protein with EDD domain
MISKVAIVTDTGAYIPPEMSANYPIFFVPFQLVWHNQVYRDGVDLTPEQFYIRLESEKEFPGTSQPSPHAFLDVFHPLVKQGYQILAIQTSSRLSGTYASALQASKMLHDAAVSVVDSGTSAMEMGFHVLAAARAAVEGATLAECKKIAEKARSHTGVFFVLNTLEYLQRGGRIGGAAAFLGSLLNIKPILHVHNGRVEAVGKVRTMRKAVESLLDIVGERIREKSPVRLSALYANEPERAKYLLDSALQRFNGGAFEIKEAFYSKISPVIGAHTGPDGVGLAYMAGM